MERIENTPDGKSIPGKETANQEETANTRFDGATQKLKIKDEAGHNLDIGLVVAQQARPEIVKADADR